MAEQTPFVIPSISRRAVSTTTPIAPVHFDPVEEVKHMPGMHDQQSHTTLSHRLGGPAVMSNKLRATHTLGHAYTPSPVLRSVAKETHALGLRNAKPTIGHNTAATSVLGPDRRARALNYIGVRRTIQADVPKEVAASVKTPPGTNPVQIGGGQLTQTPRYTSISASHRAGANTAIKPVATPKTPIAAAPIDAGSSGYAPTASKLPTGSVRAPKTNAGITALNRSNGFTVNIKPRTKPKPLPSVSPTAKKPTHGGWRNSIGARKAKRTASKTTTSKTATSKTTTSKTTTTKPKAPKGSKPTVMAGPTASIVGGVSTPQKARVIPHDARAVNGPIIISKSLRTREAKNDRRQP